MIIDTKTRRSRRRDKLMRASVDSVNTELQALYAPRKLDQYPIESQEPPDIQTYSHDAFQADIESAEEHVPDIDLLSGAPIARPYVLSTFDARPINAIDVTKTYTALEQTAAQNAIIAIFDYVVPGGYVAIFRRLQLQVWLNVTGATPIFDATTGAPNAGLTASFLNAGSAYLGFNNVRVDAAACDKSIRGSVDLPLYFLANDEETVRFQLNLAGAGATFTYAFVQPIISINLLLAEGVNPSSEPGTKFPLPVNQFQRLGRMVVDR